MKSSNLIFGGQFKVGASVVDTFKMDLWTADKSIYKGFQRIEHLIGMSRFKESKWPLEFESEQHLLICVSYSSLTLGSFDLFS